MKRLVTLAALLLVVAMRIPSAEAAPHYASIVIDFQTRKVLSATDPDWQGAPASLTKMMTLYLTFEALKTGKLSLTRRLPVSSHAASMPETKLGLRPGQRITVHDAMLGLVTRSANDAAVVLAEAMGGTESGFARLMTRKARDLGMARTTFKNASGLNARGHVSTVRDMAKLSMALLTDYPKQYGYFSKASFTYRGRTFRNHNGLLDTYEGADGIKTGYVNASGYNLAASAQRDGRRLIAVMFGGTSASARNMQVASLLDRGFNQVSTVRVAAAAPARLPPTPDRKPGVAPEPVQVAQAQVSEALRDGVGEGDEGDDDGGLLVSTAKAALPPSGGAGPWQIQVGAYGNPGQAETVARQARPRLQQIQAQVTVQPVKVKGTTLYRARLAGFDRTSALLACKQQKASGGGCLVIAPGA